jgi:Leucine-rich repeat (LRR) protein
LGTGDTPDVSLARKLVVGSLTFNLSGGRLTTDAIHGTSDNKEELALVHRIWEVYKEGPASGLYPTVAAVAENNRHVPLNCSQDLQATYLPEDPSDPRYKGFRAPNTAPHHVHFKQGMHPDGAGAPFPLRSEIEGKAAWLDLDRAHTGNSEDWWFDFGSDTVARVLEFTPHGRDWSALPGADVIHGAGQWKHSLRPSRAMSGVSPGEGVWEIHTSSGWKPLTKNLEVLKKIEEDYCMGRAHMDYTFAYRQGCGCLARQRVCSVTGTDHHPDEGIKSHMYYVDFDQMIELDGESYFRQVDLWYTLDVRRQLAVRRRQNPDFIVLKRWRNQCPELRRIWDEQTLVTEWPGITVGEAGGDSEGRVVTIHLGGKGLTGVVPASLGELTALTELRLDTNQLTGHVPESLVGLTALSQLWLNGNQLSGVVPLPLTERLTGPPALCVDNSQLPAPDPIPLPLIKAECDVLQRLRNQCPELQSLWDEHAPVSEWQGLTFGKAGGPTDGRVVGIRLGGKGLTGGVSTCFGELTALTVLMLEWNQLTGPVPASLGGLTSLSELWLYNNQLTGKVPQSLKKRLTAPSALRVSNNHLSGEMNQKSKLDRPDPPPPPPPVPHSLSLAAKSDLRALWKFRNNFFHALKGDWKDQGRSSLPTGWKGIKFGETGGDAVDRVVEIRLTKKGLSGELPECIGELTALVHLSLALNSPLSLPAEIGNLKSLKFLSLKRTGLMSLPATLGKLTSLTYLNLGGNKLTSAPEWLGGLSSLTELDLSENILTSVPKELGRLTTLTSLHLYGNRLTSVPAALGHLAALTTLTLDLNELTTLPAEFGGLTSLTKLDISRNKLTSVPKELGRLSSLTTLNLIENKLLKNVPQKLMRLRDRGSDVLQMDAGVTFKASVLSKMRGLFGLG